MGMLCLSDLILVALEGIGQGDNFQHLLCGECEPRLELVVKFGLILQIHSGVEEGARCGNQNSVCKKDDKTRERIYCQNRKNSTGRQFGSLDV